MKAIQIAYNELFETKCRLAAEAGFRHISVNFNDIPDTSDAFYDAAAEHLLSVMGRYGLKAVQTHLYYYYPLLSAEKTEEALEHRVLREIEVSGKADANGSTGTEKSGLSSVVTDGTLKVKIGRQINGAAVDLVKAGANADKVVEALSPTK